MRQTIDKDRIINNDFTGISKNVIFTRNPNADAIWNFGSQT